MDQIDVGVFSGAVTCTEFLEAGPGSPEDLALKCTVEQYN